MYSPDKLPDIIFLDEIIHYLRNNGYSKIRESVFLEEFGKCSIKSFDEYKCIFIRIPKTAGISIHRSLFDYYPIGHFNYKVFRRIYGYKKFQHYYKFSFVRNPFDRLVSSYFYFQRGGYTNSEKNWWNNKTKEIHDFNDFVQKWLIPNSNTKDHFYPQYQYIYDKNMNLKVDFLGRFERLEDDFEIVKKKLGINTKLISENKSERLTDYRYYYNTCSKKIVEKLYEKDLYLLKYNF